MRPSQIPPPQSAREHIRFNPGHSTWETIHNPWVCRDCDARSPMWDLIREPETPVEPPEIDVEPLSALSLGKDMDEEQDVLESPSETYDPPYNYFGVCGPRRGTEPTDEGPKIYLPNAWDDYYFPDDVSPS